MSSFINKKKRWKRESPNIIHSLRSYGRHNAIRIIQLIVNADFNFSFHDQVLIWHFFKLFFFLLFCHQQSKNHQVRKILKHSPNPNEHRFGLLTDALWVVLLVVVRASLSYAETKKIQLSKSNCKKKREKIVGKNCYNFFFAKIYLFSWIRIRCKIGI